MKACRITPSCVAGSQAESHPGQVVGATQRHKQSPRLTFTLPNRFMRTPLHLDCRPQQQSVQRFICEFVLEKKGQSCASIFYVSSHFLTHGQKSIPVSIILLASAREPHFQLIYCSN